MGFFGDAMRSNVKRAKERERDQDEIAQDFFSQRATSAQWRAMERRSPGPIGYVGSRRDERQEALDRRRFHDAEQNKSVTHTTREVRIVGLVAGRAYEVEVMATITEKGENRTPQRVTQRIPLRAANTSVSFPVTLNLSALPRPIPAGSLIKVSDTTRDAETGEVVCVDGQAVGHPVPTRNTGTVPQALHYMNLTPGVQYTLRSQVIDRNDHSVHGGVDVPFVASKTGSGTVPYEIEATERPGNYAVFERLLDKNSATIASHEDPYDKQKQFSIADTPLPREELRRVPVYRYDIGEPMPRQVEPATLEEREKCTPLLAKAFLLAEKILTESGLEWDGRKNRDRDLTWAQDIARSGYVSHEDVPWRIKQETLNLRLALQALRFAQNMEGVEWAAQVRRASNIYWATDTMWLTQGDDFSLPAWSAGGSRTVEKANQAKAEARRAWSEAWDTADRARFRGDTTEAETILAQAMKEWNRGATEATRIYHSLRDTYDRNTYDRDTRDRSTTKRSRSHRAPRQEDRQEAPRQPITLQESPRPTSTLQEAVKAHQKALAIRLDYESDIAKLIDFPLMTDASHPLVAAYRTAGSLAQAAIERAEIDGTVAEALTAAHAHLQAVEAAEEMTHASCWDSYAHGARKNLADAHAALAQILTGTLTVEQASAMVKRINSKLAGIVVVKKEAYEPLIELGTLPAAAVHPALISGPSKH